MTECQKTYIVLLNWNGWRDTIACLESLAPAMRAGHRVVVCDNGSTDNSLDQIQQWSRGDISANVTGCERLDRLLVSDGYRPRTVAVRADRLPEFVPEPDAQLILIDNMANLGFAAGNNTGLRFALAQDDMTNVWLLNNDTLVEPDALEKMCSELDAASEPTVVGTVIHFFDHPEVIQCFGGNRFNFRNGRAMESAGRYLHESQKSELQALHASIDYLSGCSMLLPRKFLEQVGLMNEDYFLYYEEIDWFVRAADRFTHRVAMDAHIYHREGSSIGSRSWSRPPSLVSDWHMFTSRNHFVRQYFPESFLRCQFENWLDVGKRLVKGQFRNALTVARVLLVSPQKAAQA